MSMRRAAQALVERRTERFESRHGMAQSQARLAAQLARSKPVGSVVFSPRWTQVAADRVVLEAEFAPATSTLIVLRLLSLSMALLVGASAWAIFSTQGSGALRWLLPIFTVLSILGVPLATAGLGSHREAEEARIRKAIRAALVEED
jgi:hypothetical protein